MHYTHGTSLLYFQHAISSKFPDRYSNATLNERESVLLSDEWETGNVRLREEPSHVWSTHHCSHMHVSSLLSDEEKISVCRELEAGSKILKILWKVKRFRKIFVTFFYEWTIVWTIIPSCFGSIGCSSPRVFIEGFERLQRPGWDASVILSRNSQCLCLNNQVIPPSTQIL